jgi:hypothetical protein
MHICWVLDSVRYASVCSLQSAGEAHSGPPGYQTDTRHSRAGLWDTGTGSCLRGTVPSHAETTEQLHTSPSGDKTVRNSHDLKDTSLQVNKHHLILIFYLFLQVHAEHRRGLEYSTVPYFSAAFMCYVFQRFLSRHGKVFITFQRIRKTVHLVKYNFVNS